MEELQDAIEDAQYMNAMHDEIPRPTKDWKRPTPEEMQVYMQRIKTNSPRQLELEGICEGSLGFYIFLKYLRDNGDKLYADFLMDVASYRGKFASTNLYDFAKKIFTDYLEDNSRGNQTLPEKRPASLVRIVGSHISRSSVQPFKSTDSMSQSFGDISIADSSNGDTRVSSDQQPAPQNDTSNDSNNAIPSFENEKERNDFNTILDLFNKGADLNFSATWSQYISPVIAPFASGSPSPGKPSNSILGLYGEPVTRIRSILNLFSEKASANSKNGHSYHRIQSRYLQLFDQADQIVFYYLKNKHFANFQASPQWNKYHEMMAIAERTVGEDDFSLFRILGRGGFGMVNGCKRSQTGKLYAMKIMNKKRVKMKKAESLCLNERNILTIIDSPFVVCLKYAFTTSTDLFLILDLMTGGDLGFHLGRKGRFSDREAKYYAARTLLGVAALHEQHIVYRDLKPENILMDEEGRTRISDLGLACRVGKSGLTGTCGTRGYWAPEMLRRDAAGKREKYHLTVDWFSFGCCLYEFLFGMSPFRTEKARHWGDFPKNDKADKDKAIDLAIKEMEPEFDETFDEVSRDLLRRLLDKDGKSRLGANGYIEIMSHPWFNDIDWDNLNSCPPPMVPAKDINMATQSEIGTFADEKNAKKLELVETDHKMYEKWDFISMKSFQEEVVEFYMFEEVLGPIKPLNSGNGCCIIV